MLLRGIISMKKINSINYGGKIIAIGIIFMIAFPIFFMAINKIFLCSCFIKIAKLFFGLGAGILIGFMFFLFIELSQDKRIDDYYTEHRNIKIKLENGKYECGICGSREIGENSISCNICGCRYENIEDKTPQEILKRKRYR